MGARTPTCRSLPDLVGFLSELNAAGRLSHARARVSAKNIQIRPLNGLIHFRLQSQHSRRMVAFTGAMFQFARVHDFAQVYARNDA